MSETTIIKGRSQQTATILLAAAAQLDLDKEVVRTQLGGYKVPTEVAERYEELLADLDKGDDADDKPAPRKRATKKTAAKSAAETKE